jgi:hypothetical protein
MSRSKPFLCPADHRGHASRTVGPVVSNRLPSKRPAIEGCCPPKLSIIWCAPILVNAIRMPVTPHSRWRWVRGPAPAARFRSQSRPGGNRPRPRAARGSAVRYGRSRWRRPVQPVCRDAARSPRGHDQAWGAPWPRGGVACTRGRAREGPGRRRTRASREPINPSEGKHPGGPRIR